MLCGALKWPSGPHLRSDNASIDEAHYAEVFDRRFERDLALLSDPEFRERYLTGYEITPVPRFRPDVVRWTEFLRSFARQLCLDHTRATPQSRLLPEIRRAVDDLAYGEGALDTPSGLIAFLCRKFERAGTDENFAAATEAISNYHLE